MHIFVFSHSFFFFAFLFFPSSFFYKKKADETVSVLQKILTTHANVVHLKAESEAVSQMWEKRKSESLLCLIFSFFFISILK